MLSAPSKDGKMRLTPASLLLVTLSSLSEAVAVADYHPGEGNAKSLALQGGRAPSLNV